MKKVHIKRLKVLMKKERGMNFINKHMNMKRNTLKVKKKLKHAKESLNQIKKGGGKKEMI